MNEFDRESNVQYYCRKFPVLLTHAKGSTLYDETGKSYLDFLSCAGSLNLGHNPSEINDALVQYLTSDKPLQSLDLRTDAKRDFLRTLYERILTPRGLTSYKVLFPGPTGTNAVEAALKVAVRASKRTKIVAVNGSFHGVTTGSLAVTSNLSKRNASAFPLPDVTFLPFPDGESAAESFARIQGERPAAFIFETVQAEGGVRVLPTEWLREFCALCARNGIVTICDDVQVGCGRTGTFFSFESICTPDVVVLSKSIGGGMPLSLVLLREDLDVLNPGEHNGTFRGNQLAFVAANAALPLYTDDLLSRVRALGARITDFFHTSLAPLCPSLVLRGKGLLQGIDVTDLGEGFASEWQRECFLRGLIVETCGGGRVLKLLPPLTVSDDELSEALSILLVSFSFLYGKKRETEKNPTIS